MPNEFQLIEQYFTRTPKTALLGVGDDCALVKTPSELALAISTDMLVENVHFFADVHPRKLGHKALAVNLSDIAAMGADPRWATLAIALPRVDEAWIAAFASGFFALADIHAVELIGGDTTRGPLTISITIMGVFPPGLALRRDGAAAGDDVWLSGSTGDAALALADRRGEITLDSAARERCLARLELPEPRVALGRVLRNLAHSAIDVSDGLVADLGHIAERSRLSAEIELGRLPQSDTMRSLMDRDRARAALLAGGDDYELVFTASPARRDAILAAAQKVNIEVSRIGRMQAGPSEVRVLDEHGAALDLDERGFDHFA